MGSGVKGNLMPVPLQFMQALDLTWCGGVQVADTEGDTRIVSVEYRARGAPVVHEEVIKSKAKLPRHDPVLDGDCPGSYRTQLALTYLL